MAQHHLGLLRLDHAAADDPDRGDPRHVASLARHGFTRFYFINGHGGNIATVTAAFSEIYAETSLQSAGNRPPIKCTLRNWWEGGSVKSLARELYGDSEGSHATPSEVSLTWHAYPEAAKPMTARPAGRAARQLHRRRRLSPHLPRRTHRLQPRPVERRGRQAPVRRRRQGPRRRLQGLGRPGVKQTARDGRSNLLTCRHNQLLHCFTRVCISDPLPRRGEGRARPRAAMMRA